MITAHTIVKNEENFIWYCLVSVIDHVDKILIWDTGSTDNTVQIIKNLIKKYPDKISFKEVGNVDESKYSQVRQQMLDETKSGWIFILDGDEIYFQRSICRVVSEIKNKGQELESIVVPTINLIGDMYHHQEEKAGKYKFGNKEGHFALRFINRNISGLHVGDIYGKEGYFDENNNLIQNRDENKILFIDAPYVHTTHLQRSSKDIEVMQRGKKRKYEIGISFPIDFYYPEAFFIERPKIVPNIWKRMDINFKLRAFFETPFKKIKRRILLLK